MPSSRNRVSARLCRLAPPSCLELLEQPLVLGQHTFEGAHIAGDGWVAHARFGGGDLGLDRMQIGAGG